MQAKAYLTMELFTQTTLQIIAVFTSHSKDEAIEVK
jgi:hypothetical protein